MSEYSNAMNDLKQILYERLINNGMEEGVIPGYIRCLANSMFVKPNMEFDQIRFWLEYMGWNDFELDYHTFQLAKTCLEFEGLDSLAYKPKSWYTNIFVQ